MCVGILTTVFATFVFLSCGEIVQTDMTTASRDSRAVSQSPSCESQVCQSLETLVGSIAADILCIKENLKVIDFKHQLQEGNEQVCLNKLQEQQGQVLAIQNKLQELQNNVQDNLKNTMLSVLQMILPAKLPRLEMCKRNQPAITITKYLAVLIMRDMEQTWCDTVTDGGGWVVIQRRVSGGVDFNRTWNEYKQGFGVISGDFWLGNDLISQLTMKGYNELRFDMKFKGKDYYAVYRGFKVENEAAQYKMTYTSMSGGNVADDFKENNGMKFTTLDRDNDRFYANCAITYNTGAFWWNDCGKVRVNGDWASKVWDKEMHWRSVTDAYNSLDFVEMKVRLM
ncbi:ficolin-2-like [Physella acuta]|uniref:ficolin-2-like n=1 Tax=Physella acuta TaxID=109671 RepID=UPI0027DB2BFD|nr:ficolin-2-like [Physella acuta]